MSLHPPLPSLQRRMLGTSLQELKRNLIRAEDAVSLLEGCSNFLQDKKWNRCALQAVEKQKVEKPH